MVVDLCLKAQCFPEAGWGSVLGIRIRKIRMFLDLRDPDPLIRGTDPDPDSSIRKTLIPSGLWLLYDFLS